MKVIDVSFLSFIKWQFIILSLLIIVMIIFALHFVKKEVRSKENEKNN